MDAKTRFERLIRLNNENKYEPIKNFWIDLYLNGYLNRRSNKQKWSTSMVNYLTLICCLVVLLNYLLGVVFTIDRQVSMILFDISICLGGIEVFMKVILTLMMALAIVLNYETRIKAYKQEWESILIFAVCRSRVRKIFFFKGYDNSILQETIELMKIVYKLVNISIGFLCKYIKSDIHVKR